jgi:hypothetical protein
MKMTFSETEIEMSETGIPTPERWAEIEEQRFAAAVQALMCLDEADMQRAVAEAIETQRGQQAEVEAMDRRDEYCEAQRQAALLTRYEAAKGADHKPAACVGDEIQF